MKKKILAALIAVIMILTMLPVCAYARDDLKNTDPDKYYIVLDLKNQIVFVYEKDENGEYTRLVRCFLCSSGRTEIDPTIPDDKGTPTPKGIWKIGARERFGKFASFGNEYARYWTQIVGGNYFHSIMFSKRDVNTLKSGAYRNLGNNVSHGCVRLYVEDAKWLYYYACPGTTINVSTNEPSNGELKKALKSSLPFKEYNELQKTFYDEEEKENLKAWIVYDGAPLRTGNGNNDSIRARLPLGTEVEILQEGDPWVKAKYDGKEGYILLGYVTYEQGVMQSKEDADIIRETQYMFKEPDAKSEKITKVPTYTSVKVIEPGEKWTLIEYWGEQGYMKTSNIKKGWGTIR